MLLCIYEKIANSPNPLSPERAGRVPQSPEPVETIPSWGIHTGLLAHTSDHSITAECTLFPKSVEKMNALSVISATRANPETLGPKTDQ